MTLKLVSTFDGHPLLDTVEMANQALSLYDSGLPRGDSTGWAGLDEFYTVAAAQWTVITGMPGCGKSEFLDALLVNLVEGDPRWTIAYYSPENYPPSTHMVKLAEKRVRKPFNPGPTERMTKAEFKAASTWIGQRFMWLEPTMKTPDELIRTALQYQGEGEKLGIVLDPWNTLEHQRGSMNETDYVSFILTEVTKLCRATNAHVWLVAHPAKMFRNKDGTRPVPTPYDISGSAHWFNKADNIITVHRDMVEQTQDVDVHVQKVRFKHIGHVGLATLKYDKVTGRYFELPNSGVIYDRFTGKPEQYVAP